MISNERPSPYYRQNSNLRPRHDAPPAKPHVNEDLLKSEKVQIERKSYTLLLKENPRGRFIRIIEEASGRKSSIIIPETGFESFAQALAEMVKASVEIPPNQGGGTTGAS